MKTLLHTLCLAVASGVTAEFLLGDQYLGGFEPVGQQVASLLLFTAFYGSAAVLIRELARRARAGWPGILMLALAFGVIEEGVVTQSLFNPDYVGAHLIAFGFIPWLGTAGPWLLFVLTLHVVWSIGSPIAVMEAAFGSRPWMRAGWLAVPAAFFVLGGLAIFAVSTLAGGFMANPVQLGVSVLVAVALIVLTFTVLRGRETAVRRPSDVGADQSRARRTAGRGLGYAASVVTAFVLGTLFQLADNLPHAVSPWLVAAALIAVIVAGLLVGFVLRPDALGFGTGAILTYCWVGLANALHTGPAALLEQIALVVIAIGVLTLVAVRHLRSVRREREAGAGIPQHSSTEVAGA
jgi:hypothetical protein